MEMKNRVALPLLSHVISHLEKLIKFFQRLKAVLEVDLIEHTTSVPGQIHASINTIAQQTQNSLVEFSTQIVDKFSDYYEQNMDFAVTQLVRSAKAILSHQFYFMNIDVNDTDSFDINRTEEVFRYKDNFCDDLKLLDSSIEYAVSGANFSTKLYLDRTCFAMYYGCVRMDMPERNSIGYIQELVDKYEFLHRIAKAALRCVPMYHAVLNEVKSWLKNALTMNSSLPLQPEDRRYVLTELEQELNWLKAISRTLSEETLVCQKHTHTAHICSQWAKNNC